MAWWGGQRGERCELMWYDSQEGWLGRVAPAFYLRLGEHLGKGGVEWLLTINRAQRSTKSMY